MHRTKEMIGEGSGNNRSKQGVIILNNSPKHILIIRIQF